MCAVVKTHRIERAVIDGVEEWQLASPAGLCACLRPTEDMTCRSLSFHQEEYLYQAGVPGEPFPGAFSAGIRFLHPWANRLDRAGYEIGERRVDFLPSSQLVYLDERGCPLHGLVLHSYVWKVTATRATDTAAELIAELSFASDHEAFAVYPFAHRIEMRVRASGSDLRFGVTIRSTADDGVPVAVGFHPNFVLPGVPRASWLLEAPERKRMRLDDRRLPTGEADPLRASIAPLADNAMDDHFVDLTLPTQWALIGRDRRIAVTFISGFPAAQVFAPVTADLVAIEPMAAQTNPFTTGTYQMALADRPFQASFQITVG